MRLRRLARAESPRPRLVVTVEMSLGQPINTELASTGRAVLAATADGKVRALAARDLSPAATVDLPSPRTFGPVAVGDHGFVADALGDVFAFGLDGTEGKTSFTASEDSEFVRVLAPVVESGHTSH